MLLGGSKGDVAQEGLPRLSEGPKSSAWKVMALVTAADRQQCDEVHRLLRAGPRPSLPPTWQRQIDSHLGSWPTPLAGTFLVFPFVDGPFPPASHLPVERREGLDVSGLKDIDRGLEGQRSCCGQLQHYPARAHFPHLKHFQSGLDVQEHWRGSWTIPQWDLLLDSGDKSSGVDIWEPGCSGADVHEKGAGGLWLGVLFWRFGGGGYILRGGEQTPIRGDGRPLRLHGPPLGLHPRFTAGGGGGPARSRPLGWRSCALIRAR